MKRMHMHVSVEDLNQSIGFYSTLFGRKPSVVKEDYAKWMLDDPRINFAISMRGAKPGLDHLGIQVDKPEELEGLRKQLKEADMTLFDEGATTCCYANSEKSWVKDPSGIAWETYHTMADAEIFSSKKADGSTCCAPKVMPESKLEAKTASCSAGSGCC